METLKTSSAFRKSLWQEELNLIAIDLDGTTLNNNSELTQETIDTLHAVKNLVMKWPLSPAALTVIQQYYDQLKPRWTDRKL